MTFAELSQLITALAALGAVIMSVRNGTKIHDVHLSINSRMTELLAAAREAAHAAGAQEEKQRLAPTETTVTVPEQKLIITKPADTD